MTSTPDQKSISQDAAPQAKNTTNRSAFLGAVNSYYSGRKSILKSLKDCSLSPCSEEYTFVMQGFKEVEEESVKSIAPPRRLKNRKTSLNDFAREKKLSPTTSRLENDHVVQFRQRPRGYTLPAERVSEVRIPCEKELSTRTKGNTKTRELDVAFGTNVQLAWQEIHDDPFSIQSAKKECRRHVSLCYQTKRQEGNENKNSETSPQPGNVLCSKEIRRRRKPETELPRIKERGFIDDLQRKRNNSIISDKTQGKVSVAGRYDQMKGSIKDLARGENWLALYSQRQRSYSCENFTGSRDTTKMKPSLAYSLSLPETGHVNVSEKTLAPLNLRNNDCELKALSDKAAISRRTSSSQFSITRANLRRVGQATLVATRLLKIHYRENAIKNDVNITQEEKELEELFEEMKDCRYLRQSKYEMRN